VARPVLRSLGLVLRKEDWEVKDAPFAEGKDLVSKYHYAKGGSLTFVYMHGLYRKSDDALCGIVWWLPPTRVACESVNKDQWKQVLGLTRMVVVPDVPKNACTFLLAASVRKIRAEGRFVSLVTYADESQGHTGGVYRAANWNYIGRTGPYPRWIDPASGRQVAVKATKSRTKAEMEALGYVKQGSFHKHKYVLHLK